MFRFGHTRFQALTTMNDSGNMISFLQTTNLPLSNADANSATATLLLGKMVDYAAADETQMRLGTGFAVGILGQSINLNGTTDDLGFKKLTVGGFPDIPAKRGLAVGIFCPFP